MSTKKEMSNSSNSLHSKSSKEDQILPNTQKKKAPIIPLSISNKSEVDQKVEINGNEGQTKSRKEVFIGGLPVTTNTGNEKKFKFFLEEVKNYLLKFGPLEYCRLALTKNEFLKGFGFAEFVNEEDARKACGKHHVLRNKKVNF